jgi:hypothetical protein
MSTVLSREIREDQFRGVTKLIPQVITQRNPAAGFYQCPSRQGFLDDSNRSRKRVAEDCSVTANSRGILGSSNTGMEQGAALRRVGIGRAFSPRECGSLAVPGALPQAGMALGLWPSTRQATSTPRSRLPRQRRISISAWGIAPGIRPPTRMRAEGPTHLTAPCHNRSRIS